MGSKKPIGRLCHGCRDYSQRLTPFPPKLPAVLLLGICLFMFPGLHPGLTEGSKPIFRPTVTLQADPSIA